MNKTYSSIPNTSEKEVMNEEASNFFPQNHFKSITEKRKEIEEKYKLIHETDDRTFEKRRTLLQKNMKQADSIKMKYTFFPKKSEEKDQLASTMSVFTKKKIMILENNPIKEEREEEKKITYKEPVFRKINPNKETSFNKTSVGKFFQNGDKENEKTPVKLDHKRRTISTRIGSEMFNSPNKNDNSLNTMILPNSQINSASTGPYRSKSVFRHEANSVNPQQTINKQNSTSSNIQPFNSPSQANKRMSTLRSLMKSKRSFLNSRMSFLDIPPEDEIFEQYRSHPELMGVIEEHKEANANAQKPVVINKPKLDKVQKKLFEIYHLDFEYLHQMKEAKKQKKKLDLEKYQTNLVNIMSSHISKDSMRKLNEELRRIRRLSNKVQHESIGDFMDEIEKWEQDIITNLIKKQGKLEIIRGSKLSANSPLPKIRYKKVSNNTGMKAKRDSDY